MTKRHFRACAFIRSFIASFKWWDELHCCKRSRWKKTKEWRNRLIIDNVNTVFLNLPGSHRDMMRVAEIIVAFVFRSTRRVDSPLNEISDFLSCDTIAVTFNGCDSEKRTFWLKRKVGPNPDYLSDVSWYSPLFSWYCFREI